MFKKIKELITQEEKLKEVLRRALGLEDYAKMIIKKSINYYFKYLIILLPKQIKIT